MADYFQVKNQNIFNPPANTSLGNATNQFNDVYVQNDLVLGNVTVTGDTIIAPRVTTITYPGDDTAADTAGGQTITLTGTGFVAGANVLINGSAVGVVSVVSSTTITFTSPANATGSYVIYVVNPDGSTAIAIPGIQYSGTPNWTTAAGTLGNVYETASFTQTVTATGDAPITYSVVTGSIPPGSTFNSNGTITGTSQLTASPTTYSFTVRATDAQLQDTNRAFSISVIPDVVTWSSPTNNATYTPAANVAIANITLSATSAVGSGITYSANTLPTGLSLTGANISGTPTVVANTSSLLTATANTTSESSSITINWSVSVASDPYFMYNSLLLPGTGSNGAQNNTFLDGSTNNFTITRNGNTTQGTFSPYGPNWSNYFDGSGDYLSASGAITNSGTGDFSFEAWVYYTGTYANYNFVFDSRASGSPTTGFNVALDITTGYWYWGQSAQELLTSTPCPKNAWVHICATRQSGVIRLFQNGILIGYVANTSNLTNTGALIGTYYSVNNYYWPGYISNLRVQKNSVPISYQTSNTTVGTSIFTPQTTPLTAIANTSLLTCQSNRFIDNSTNNFTITKFGDTSIQRFSPFSPTAAYSAGTIGGSGYFDGTGDYLSAPSNAAFDFGTGDFTVEFWINTSLNSAAAFVGTRTNDTAQTIRWCIYAESSGGLALGCDIWSTTDTRIGIFAFQSPLPLGQWVHCALVRNGTSFKLYQNGVQSTSGATSSAAVANSSTVVNIGSFVGSAIPNCNGYISNLRIIKGTAVYTSSFTPPTAPVTAISGTSLLLNYTNAGIIDNTMINNLETVGNAQISTGQTKFGSGSMYFDGTGDYLVVSPNVTNNLGTGDFTIEAWVYLTSGSTYQFLIGSSDNATGFMMIGINVPLSPTSTIAIGRSGINWPVQFGAGITITSNTWTHIAITRSGTTNRAFINGVQLGSNVTDSTSWAFPSNIMWVGFQTGGTAFNGYIDDLRITKGYARYTVYSATTSNTTASSIRSGSSLAGFFGSYGVFNTTAAGQYLLVDFGVSVSNIQTTYLNYNGGQWAPTSVLIQTSNDNSTWSTVVTYSDNNTNTLQTIPSTGSGRYWRIYQNSATRQNSAGYEWHLGSFTMTTSFTPPTAALPTY